MAGFVPSGAADVGWYSYPPPVAMTAVANGPYLDGHWNVFTSAQRIFTLEGTLVAPSVPEPRLSFALVLLLGIMLAIQARRTTRGAA
jgi:hypothetical protein